MWNFILSMATGIWPPRDVTDQNAVYGWMRSVFTSLVGIGAVLILLAVLSFGWSPFFPGFALASALDMQQTTLQAILVGQQRDRNHILDGLIIEAKTRHCQASFADPTNPVYVQDSLRKLLDLQSEWRDAHDGREYAIPGCSDLGFK